MLDVAVGPYAGKQSGETALLRTLLGGGTGGAGTRGAGTGALERGDALLADPYYASLWLIAVLLARGSFRTGPPPALPVERDPGSWVISPARPIAIIPPPCPRKAIQLRPTAFTSGCC